MGYEIRPAQRVRVVPMHVALFARRRRPAVWKQIEKGILDGTIVLARPGSEEALSKAGRRGGHKYIRRIPTGNPKKPYVYVYAKDEGKHKHVHHRPEEQRAQQMLLFDPQAIGAKEKELDHQGEPHDATANGPDEKPSDAKLGDAEQKALFRLSRGGVRARRGHNVWHRLMRLVKLGLASLLGGDKDAGTLEITDDGRQWVEQWLQRRLAQVKRTDRRVAEARWRLLDSEKRLALRPTAEDLRAAVERRSQALQEIEREEGRDPTTAAGVKARFGLGPWTVERKPGQRPKAAVHESGDWRITFSRGGGKAVLQWNDYSLGWSTVKRGRLTELAREAEAKAGQVVRTGKPGRSEPGWERMPEGEGEGGARAREPSESEPGWERMPEGEREPAADGDQPKSRKSRPRAETFGSQAGWTKGERTAANARALEIVQNAAAAGRILTDEEREEVAKYSGKGGAGSSLNQFFTRADIAESIWGALGHLGITSGSVLEPSCGAGVFLETAPDGVQVDGVEIDGDVAAVARALHGHRHRVAHEPLEEHAIRYEGLDDGRYTAVVGNAPFALRTGNTARLHKPHLGTADHYFLDTALDEVEAGGVVAMIVHKGVMLNAKARDFRERLMARAELVDAFWQPMEAQDHSHTQVPGHLLILRKRDPDVAAALDEGGEELMRSAGVWDDDFAAGRWFESRPSRIIGERTTDWRGAPDVTGTADAVAPAIERGIRDDIDRGPASRSVTLEQVRAAAGADEDLLDAVERGIGKRPTARPQKGAARVVAGVSYVLLEDGWHRMEDVEDVAKIIAKTPSDALQSASGLAAQIGELKGAVDSGDLYRARRLRRTVAARVREWVDLNGSPSEHEELVALAKKDRGLWRLIGAVNDDGTLSDLLHRDPPVIEPTAELDQADIVAVGEHIAARNDGWVSLADVVSLWAGDADEQAARTALLDHDDFALTLTGEVQHIEDFLAGNQFDLRDSLRRRIAMMSEGQERDKFERQAELVQERIDSRWRLLDDVEISTRSGWIPPHVISAFLNSEVGRDAVFGRFRFGGDLEYRLRFENSWYSWEGRRGERIRDDELVAQVGKAKSGGPYIGPRGGKWADPAHKIPWREDAPEHLRQQHSVAVHHGLRSEIDTEMLDFMREFAAEDGTKLTAEDERNYTKHEITAPDESKIGGIRLTHPARKDWHAVIHRSTKGPGKWQVSWFDKDGPVGDTQKPSLNAAIKDAMRDGYRLSEVVKKGLGERTRHDDGTGHDLLKFLNRLRLGKQARSRVEEIEEVFAEWLRGSEWREEIEERYNRRFFAEARREFSTAEVKISGKNPDLRINPHLNQTVRWAAARGKGIIALDVGLGKTFGSIMLARHLRDTGRARKPFVVVPKSVATNWQHEIETLTPGAKVLVIGEHLKEISRGPRKGQVVAERDSPEERNRKLALAAQNDYDLVICTMPAFQRIPLKRNTIDRYVEDDFFVQRAEAIDSAATAGDPDKARAKLRAQWETKEAKKQYEHAADLVFWEDLGVDCLIADEAHAYKNLYAARSRFGRKPKFLGSTGDDVKRPRDMQFKARLVREARGEDNDGVYFLTATPITNSPLEIYTMLSHLAPEELSERGIRNGEEFIDRYCDVEEQLVLNIEGEVERAPAVVGFKNLRELRELMDKYILFRNAEEVGVALPKVRVNTELIEMTDEQKAIYDDLRQEAADADPKEDPGAILRVLDKMKKAAQDLELLYPDDRRYEGWHKQSPKYRAAVRNILEGAERGGQVVFADHNAIHDRIRGMLVDAGMPEDQIEIINAQTAKDSASRHEIGERLNTGKIKVVIGNTGTMGEGVNLQKNTTDIHHLDQPWTPAAIQQRNGRGVRQGNKHRQVTVHTYLAKASFDGFRWNTVRGKRNWMDKMRAGADRVKNDEAEIASDDEMLIMLAEDPDKARAELGEQIAQKKEAWRLKRVAETMSDLGRMLGMRARLEQVSGTSKTAQVLRQKIDRLHRSLSRNEMLPESARPLLDSDQPALVDPATHKVYMPEGVIVREAEVAGGTPRKWVITKVDIRKKGVRARLWGSSGSEQWLSLEKLSAAWTPSGDTVEGEMQEALQRTTDTSTRGRWYGPPAAEFQQFEDDLLIKHEEPIRAAIRANVIGRGSSHTRVLVRAQDGALVAADRTYLERNPHAHILVPWGADWDWLVRSAHSAWTGRAYDNPVITSIRDTFGSAKSADLTSEASRRVDDEGPPDRPVAVQLPEPTKPATSEPADPTPAPPQPTQLRPKAELRLDRFGFRVNRYPGYTATGRRISAGDGFVRKEDGRWVTYTEDGARAKATELQRTYDAGRGKLPTERQIQLAASLVAELRPRWAETELSQYGPPPLVDEEFATRGELSDYIDRLIAAKDALPGTGRAA